MTDRQRQATKMGIIEQELIAMQEGPEEDIKGLPPAYQYKCYKPLLETPKEISSLPSWIRELHSWYIFMSNGEGKNTMFGVRVLQEMYRTDGEEQMWVKFDCLSNLFQKCALDLQILSIWSI